MEKSSRENPRVKEGFDGPYGAKTDSRRERLPIQVFVPKIRGGPP